MIKRERKVTTTLSSFRPPFPEFSSLNNQPYHFLPIHLPLPRPDNAFIHLPYLVIEVSSEDISALLMAAQPLLFRFQSSLGASSRSFNESTRARARTYSL